MLKRIHSIFLVFLLACFALPALGQVQPCLQGTLADVLGTSCSVGPLTLNFGTAFNGHSAAEIQFVPVHSHHKAGFKLITNFVDAPAGNPSTGHIVQFGYTPQAASGFEIRVAEAKLDATAQGSADGIAFAQSNDFQNFPVSGFINTDAALNVDHNVVVTSQLTNDVFLQVPAFAADGKTVFAPFSTQLSDFASGNATVSLNSVTYLYAVEPVVPTPRRAPLTYTNIDLPGIPSTTVSGINDLGQVVGVFQDSLGTLHGYLTEKRGGFTTINFPGATSTSASGVNNRGDVVGFFVNAAGHSHGFLLQRGNFTQIDAPDALLTFPISINDRGQIVGGFQSADQGFHGFLLENGRFTTIDQVPGTGAFASTDAVGINDRGEIAGDFFDPNTFRGFIQHRNFTERFDIPGQGFLLAGGINQQGDFVGAFEDVTLAQHGVFRSREGRFLTVDFPGGSNSFALAINAAGWIVGTYDDAEGIAHSFLAKPRRDHDDDEDDRDHDGHSEARSDAGSHHGQHEMTRGSSEWRERIKHSRAAWTSTSSH